MLIGVVILNYNTFPDTIRLTKELQSQTVNELSIVIVDNFSTNNSYAELKPLESEFSNVKVVQTGENLGYARGNNFGLEYLEKNVNPKYVVVLNNDVILPDNCFERLYTRYEELLHPGIVAPLMLEPGGNQGFLTYKVRTFWQDCLYSFYLPRLIADKTRKQIQSNMNERDLPVEIIPGSFMFASLEAFKGMGYFYPGTFLYGEERFIATKAKLKGLTNYIIQDQTFIHAHNSPTINSVYGQVAKFKMLHEAWLKYTIEYRRFGKLKAAILKPLMKYSIWEIVLVSKMKTLFK